MKIPPHAAFVIDGLEAAGYEAWLVGGCVRDSLLGRSPKDWDVATCALPEQTARCFPGAGLVKTGSRHGTIGIVTREGVVEATTFRVEGEYTGRRRPKSLRFTKRIQEDLKRRDFTINAMAYHQERGLFDPLLGERDLRRGLLRCVGEPDRRFGEDALRILRCLRFSAELGFRIEEESFAAAVEHRGLIARLSGERVREETGKLICGEYAGEAMDGGREIILCALEPLRDVPAGLFKAAGPYRLPKDPAARWAALLAGCDEYEKVLRRLRFSNREAGRISALIEGARRGAPRGSREVKRLLARLGQRDFFILLDLLGVRDGEGAVIEQARQAAKDALARGDCLCLKELKVNGSDLIAAGRPGGPGIGRELGELLELVLAGRVENHREALLAWIQKRGKNM